MIFLIFTLLYLTSNILFAGSTNEVPSHTTTNFSMESAHAMFEPEQGEGKLVPPQDQVLCVTYPACRGGIQFPGMREGVKWPISASPTSNAVPILYSLPYCLLFCGLIMFFWVVGINASQRVGLSRNPATG